MIRALLALLVLALAAAPGAAHAAEPRANLPDVEDEVMCISCGTVLNVSQAPSADRTRAFIRRRIDEGLTKQEIKDRLVVEFGEGVLALPPASGRDVPAYAVPAALALLAILTIGLTARRWRHVSRTEPDPGEDLSEADAQRLERDMRHHGL